MVCEWKVSVHWGVQQYGSRVCGKGRGSALQGSWSRSKESRNQDGFQEVGKRLTQFKKVGSPIDNKSFVINAIKCFGIWCLSVSRIEVTEGSMEGKHFVITRTLTMNSQDIPTYVLIDCNAPGIAFVVQDFARHDQMPLKELLEKLKVQVIDRRPVESGNTTHIAKTEMAIQDH